MIYKYNVRTMYCTGRTLYLQTHEFVDKYYYRILGYWLKLNKPETKAIFSVSQSFDVFLIDKIKL